MEVDTRRKTSVTFSAAVSAKIQPKFLFKIVLFWKSRHSFKISSQDFVAAEFWPLNSAEILAENVTDVFLLVSTSISTSHLSPGVDLRFSPGVDLRFSRWWPYLRQRAPWVGPRLGSLDLG